MAKSQNQWNIHFPPKLVEEFQSLSPNQFIHQTTEKLELTTTLRSHQAQQLHIFTSKLDLF
ncbi:MAG: hypothetical protein ACTSYI_16870 [Promethearchaeota archaeon]